MGVAVAGAEVEAEVRPAEAAEVGVVAAGVAAVAGEARH